MNYHPYISVTVSNNGMVPRHRHTTRQCLSSHAAVRTRIRRGRRARAGRWVPRHAMHNAADETVPAASRLCLGLRALLQAVRFSNLMPRVAAGASACADPLMRPSDITSTAHAVCCDGQSQCEAQVDGQRDGRETRRSSIWYPSVSRSRRHSGARASPQAERRGTG